MHEFQVIRGMHIVIIVAPAVTLQNSVMPALEMTDSRHIFEPQMLNGGL
ncbi:hypothetical protein [Undibacterium oligocarboniphilum]|uniref:Uncharacterized protein n=1 Tax=Undibacterium oligocarboniphilum TaxID=666702 RepID=A0A850QFN1_9BURK|nr:hypothetical protein [Undibacterium oligocarboniphilum]MBC3869620.1 hypothetical protein [Undibacterium oligocarboniphilum]NVO77999.1 hypothetical protein [Undibacterium oligocarboniphilum]